jgi:hypothetical protein
MNVFNHYRDLIVAELEENEAWRYCIQEWGAGKPRRLSTSIPVRLSVA